MRKLLPLLLLVLLLTTAIAATAGTVDVNFDDLVGSGLVPDGYGGITWYGNWTYYGDVQPPYNPSSPPNRVYDLSSTSNYFSFSTPEVFLGAYFAGNAFATVTFDLYNGSTLVWTSGTLVPSDVPTFLPSGYGGLVTKVVVDSPSPDFFIMDDVMYSTGGGSTPEPSSLLLLGTGIVGAVGVLRRKIRL